MDVEGEAFGVLWSEAGVRKTTATILTPPRKETVAWFKPSASSNLDQNHGEAWRRPLLAAAGGREGEKGRRREP